MPVPTSFSDLDTVAANNSPPGTETAKGNVDNYLRSAFSFIKQLYNSGYPTSLVRRLIGNVNSGTPLTKYDMAADIVVLQNSTTGTVTRTATGTLTCDLGLAGSAANGRDQLAAFSANSWIYLYFIWNGTTLATVASTSSTSPTLPSGYTHWAFATTVRWNASSNIIPCRTNGATVFYDLADGGVNRVLNGGTATTMTTVSFANFVPPNALRASFNFSVLASSSGVGNYGMYVRPTGASHSGIVSSNASVQVLNATVIDTNSMIMPLGTSQQMDYKIGTAPTSGGCFIDVIGFIIPNGDE